jgi:hypothetical protein
MPINDTLRLRVTRRGRRRAPLASDVNLSCSYSCSSIILMD